MNVDMLADAQREMESLPANERFAMENAIEKLELHGDALPFPHSSKVEGSTKLRELRPRAGRSPWRAFYRRIGESICIGAIGPEARSDPRGFRRAIAAAEDRLAAVEDEQRRHEA